MLYSTSCSIKKGTVENEKLKTRFKYPLNNFSEKLGRDKAKS